MRHDMFELIIERPRGGSGRSPKGRARQRARSHPDLAPSREPMSIGRGSKWLNENLAPLKRFLLSQIGRPWDKVHAEICEHITMNSAVQKHVLDHVRQMVELDVVMIDGRPHRPNPIYPLGGTRYEELYVCPRTGLLRLAPYVAPPARKERPDVRRIDDHREARRIDGIWYLVTFAPLPQFPDTSTKACFDVVLAVRLRDWRVLGSGGLLYRAYGRSDRYAVAKRQLSSKEIRAFAAS
jgi:hypothetical protein